VGRPSTPWTDPKEGDVSVLIGGTRRVIQPVSHIQWNGGSCPDRVVYDQGGATKTCSAERWATTARNAMQGGGSYERGNASYCYEGGRFIAEILA